MLNWEIIPQDQAGSLSRCKVPNGWLVKEVQEVYTDLKIDHIPILETNGYTWTSSLVFIPDAKHEWNINTIKEEFKLKVYLTLNGIDDFHRPVFKDKNSSNRYGDINCSKTGKPEDVIAYYKDNIDKLEYFGTSFNCEPHGGINSNIQLIIE